MMSSITRARRAWIAAMMCCAASFGARADEPPAIFTEAEAALFASAVALPAGAPAWRVAPRPDLFAAACAGPSGGRVRLAVVSAAPTRRERELCQAALNATVTAAPIAREAVIVVAREAAPVLSLTPAQMFHALSAAMGGPTRWTQIDPTLPDAPIAVLLPRDAGLTRLFAAAILEPGCARALGTRAAFGAAARAEQCAALRADAAVAHRQGDADDVARWLDQAGPAGLAVVSFADYRALGARVRVVAIDGVLPTAANVAANAYPAMRDLHLVVIRPRDAGPPARRAAVEIAFALATERAIGPAGEMAARGLSPLGAADRVAAREMVFDALED